MFKFWFASKPTAPLWLVNIPRAWASAEAFTFAVRGFNVSKARRIQRDEKRPPVAQAL